MRLFVRRLAELWRGPLIAGVVIALFLPLAVLSYRGVDLTAFEALPEPLLQLMGIAVGASPETLAYTMVLGTYGALTLTAVAIAMATRAAVGEETERTLPLVLSTPVSRGRFIVIGALAALTVIVLMAGVVLAASLATAAGLDLAAGDSRFVAQWLHLVGTVAFHAFLAFGLAAATGRRRLAGTVAAVVMVLGLFSSGLLQLTPETAELSEWVPWYWMEGATPLVHGVEPLHLSLLGGGAAVFALVGMLVFPRRDLRNFAEGGLLTALVKRPFLQRLADTLRLSSRGLWSHTLNRNLALATVVALIMFALMGVAMGPLYVSMEDQLGSLSQTMSAELLALFGAGDFTTPEGFFQAETLGMMAPIAVIVVGVAMASSLAGEERAHRAGLLYAQPVSRTRALGAVVVGMAVHVAGVALLSGLGIWLGSVIAGLGVSLARCLVAAGMIFALGMAISALALVVGAATGSPAAGTWTAVAVAVASHFGNALMALTPETSGWAWLSPFNWYAHVNPLLETPDPWRVAALVTMAVVLILLAFPLYRRRDLRR